MIRKIGSGWTLGDLTFTYGDKWSFGDDIMLEIGTNVFGSYPYIAADSLGNIYAAGSLTSYPTAVRLKRYNYMDQEWVELAAPPETNIGDISLYIDGNDDVYMCCRKSDVSSHPVVYKYTVLDDTWAGVGSSFATENFIHTQMVGTSTGNPLFVIGFDHGQSYTYEAPVRGYKWNGSSWADMGTVCKSDSYGARATLVPCTSADGKCYVFCYNTTASPAEYSAWEYNSSWTKIGSWTSQVAFGIVCDTDNKPVIAYQDGGAILFQKWSTGTTWTTIATHTDATLVCTAGDAQNDMANNIFLCKDTLFYAGGTTDAHWASKQSSTDIIKSAKITFTPDSAHMYCMSSEGYLYLSTGYDIYKSKLRLI